MKEDFLQTIANIENLLNKIKTMEIIHPKDFNAITTAYLLLQEIKKEDAGDAILDKFESDCMNAPNFAEGLRIAFDNLPDNFLK